MTPRQLAPLCLLAAAIASSCAPHDVLVYIGTYTITESEGIHRLKLDRSTGALTPLGVTPGIASPSFLAVHPQGRHLFAVNEVGEFEGAPGGAVAAFAIDPETGDLALLDRGPSGGPGPCHLVADPSGRNVLVANYGGGSVSALPIEADGRLGEPSAFVQHQGSSVNPRRQEGPHAHSINVDGGNRFAVAADLGLDKLLVYRFDPARGSLEPNDPPAAAVAPGAGPRHFAFHPGGRFAYAINELASTVTAFTWDGERGVLEEIETVSTLPPGFVGDNSTAEVQVHPSGRFLYGSNRGHDSIAVFAIDRDSGRLTPVEHEPSGGKTPRNFGIDPSGRFLLAANQGSDLVVVFRIDRATGALEPTGHVAGVRRPVCVKFLER